MRLLTIGRSPSSNIVYTSQAVSALHAELILLNNGDIILIDKNSVNGTFVMNKQVKPETEVTVRRGDSIRFADKELQWGDIPLVENNSKYKCLYGIGSNYRNEIQLPGNTISRFHATLKITKDNKAYIEDHSKNGTTINGVKIQSGENIRLKRKDVILCGGELVDIKKYISTSLFDKSRNAIISLGTAAAIIAGVFLMQGTDFHDLFPFTKNPTPAELIPATVYVHAKYVIVVTLEDDPFIYGINGWPKEWIYGVLNDEFIFDPDIQNPLSYSGTSFFITKSGIMGTNRHIALPWEYLSDINKEKIHQNIELIRHELLPSNELNINNLEKLLTEKNFLSQKLSDYIFKQYNQNPENLESVIKEVNGWITRFKKSPVKISGRIIYMAVGYPNRNYDSEQEFARCTVLKASDDPKKDVALLQLNDKNTPKDIKYIYDILQAKTDPKSLKPQGEDLYTTGYPAGLNLGLRNEDGGLKPTIHKVTISKEPGEIDFEFQGEELGGASGSPIFDRKGHLVGVLWGGYIGTATFGTACLVKHIKELYDKTNTK